MYSDDEDFEEETQEKTSLKDKLLDFYQNNKKMVLIAASLLLLLFILLMVNSCSNSQNNIDNPQGGKNTPVVVMLEGDTYVAIDKMVTLHAQLENSEKLGVSDPEWKWMSSNTDVATVDSLGNVYGKSYGEAYITATYIHTNKQTYPVKCKVIVGKGDINISLASASFGDNELLMGINQEFLLNDKIIITPSDAYITSEKYTSSNTSVAIVDNKGYVKSLSAGVTTITVLLNNNISVNLVVNVVANETSRFVKPVVSLAFEKQIETITVGKSQQIAFNYLPSDAYIGNLEWSSSNPFVVSVDNKGVITGKSNGSAIITVKNNHISEQITVTVGNAIVQATSLEISSSNISLNQGNTYTIMTNVLPENTTNKSLSYSSTNSSVATVNSSGVITAISCGTASVYVQTTDGSNLSKIVNVTVSGCSQGGSSGGSSSGSSSNYVEVHLTSCKSGECGLWYSKDTAKKYPTTSPIEISFGSSVSYVRYCYTKYNNSSSSCELNSITYTNNTQFTISSSGLYLVRVAKYDKRGNVIDSDSSYYNKSGHYFELYVYISGSQGGSSGGSSSDLSLSGKIAGRAGTGFLGLGERINYYFVDISSNKTIDKLYYCISNKGFSTCSINTNLTSSTRTYYPVYGGSSCTFFADYRGSKQRYQKLETGKSYIHDITNSTSLTYNIAGFDTQYFCVIAKFDDGMLSSQKCIKIYNPYGYIQGCN